MTPRQIVLKIVYPLVMAFRKRKAIILLNEQHVKPKSSFYLLSVTLNNGKQLSFENFRKKKVLLVNTASDCGYTAQYSELQKLQDQFSDRLVVIGFPSNNFKEQEKGNDEAIAQFCQVNFGVHFPLAKKTNVIGKDQQPVFQWLCKKDLNGWNDKKPKWNFAKYLVNEEGVLTHYFDPAISPLSKEVLNAISKTYEVFKTS